MPGADLTHPTRRAPVRAAQRRTAGSAPGLALWTACCVVLALVSACAEEASEQPLVYARTVRDLLRDPAEFEVLEPNPRAPHTLGRITPSMHHLQDGAELRALVLPPPAAVRFDVGEFDGPRFLRLRAGMDVSAARFLRRKYPGGEFTFEVLINGEPAARAAVSTPAEPEPPWTEWQPLPGANGLRVRAGDVITLRTGLFDATGAAVPAPIGPRIGFGGLRLEQVVRRARAEASPAAPNLIVVVVDTLHRDRLSAYGYEHATSPALESLARRGTLFEEAYATSPWTWPSTASLLTGLQVREHGVESYRSSFLAADLTTLAEVCQDAGLSTAGWSGNPLIAERHGFAQGFERLTSPTGGFQPTGEYFDEVQAWLAEHASERFLLYLHLVEPHHPLQPLPRGRALFAPQVAQPDERLAHDAHPAWRENTQLGAEQVPLEELFSAQDQRDISALYDACVWSADAWLRRLLEQVDELGLEERTLIVFTSDHGEELFDHGQLGHGRTLYDELVRVPLVLAGPGVPAGQRLSAPVSNRHLAAYLASRVGSSAFGAGDLLERGAATPADVGPLLFSTRVGLWDSAAAVEILGLRDGPLVTHYALAAPAPEGSDLAAQPFDAARLRLFDVERDPEQRVDLAAQDPERARAAWAALLAHFEALARVRGPRVESVDAGTLELLRNIGYIGR